MKKMLIGIIIGVAIATVVFAGYAHKNLLSMNQVTEIHETETGAEIITKSGDLYSWKR